MKYLILLCAILFLATNCDYGPNNDGIEELSCEQTSGVWMITTASCNGQKVVQLPFSTISFDENSFAHWSVGTSDCQSKVNNIVHHVNGGINLFGQGSYSCVEDGVVSNSCSGVQSDCDSSVSAANRNQTFSTCVVEGVTKLRLARVVTQENINDQLSFCKKAGEIEDIEYQPTLSGPANLYFTSGPAYGFPNTLPGQIAEVAKITLINSGTSDATQLSSSVISPPFYFAGGNYPGIGGTCSSILPAASACQITLGFQPQAVDAFEQHVTFTFNNGSGMTSIPFRLLGTGEQPLAELERDPEGSIDFGSVQAGSTKSIFITLSNTGNGPATSLNVGNFLPPFYFTGNVFPGTGGTCTNTLAASSSCTVEVEVRPSGPGIFAHSIDLHYFDGTSNVQSAIKLKASGVTAGP